MALCICIVLIFSIETNTCTLDTTSGLARSLACKIKACAVRALKFETVEKPMYFSVPWDIYLYTSKTFSKPTILFEQASSKYENLHVWIKVSTGLKVSGTQFRMSSMTQHTTKVEPLQTTEPTNVYNFSEIRLYYIYY